MTGKTTLRAAGRLTILATNLVILTVIAAFFAMAIYIDTTSRRDDERATALEAMDKFASMVSIEITNALLVGTAFEGAITLQNDMTQGDFTSFAREIVKGHEAVVNVATIRDYTVEFVHPYEENAHVIGRKLDDIPAQRAIAEEALRDDKHIFQGPVPLLQGFPGFILRVPIILTTEEISHPWGLISIVFSAEKLLSHLESGAIPDQYMVAIRKADDGTAILGNQNLFQTDALHKTLEVPNGAWTLAVRPKGGWSGMVIEPSKLLIFALISFAAIATTNMIFRLRREAVTKADQLRAAIDVLGDGFVLFDATDRLVVCNERYREIYKESAPAIKPGATFRSILEYGIENGQYQEAIGREEEWLQERLNAHHSVDFTLVQHLTDGRWLRVREMATPDGGRVGIRVDITEQVESGKRAEVAETRLRDAIDTVPAAFLFFDAEGKLELVNSRSLQLFPDARARLTPGVPIRKLLERLVYLELPNEDRKTRHARVEELLVLLRHKTSQFDLHVGNNRYFKIVSQRTQEGGVVCFGVDISDLIAQERWLESANKRLQDAIRERDAAEARFADVADIATEWFWEQDANMRLTYLSPRFEKSVGLPLDKALGRSAVELMNRESDAVIEEHLKKMQNHEPFENFIYQSKSRDDHAIWLRTSGKPVFDDDGKFRGYIGTAADVSELYGALQQAKHADEAKTQFLNMISHELRTPMTVVLGYNAFLKNPEALPKTRLLRDVVAEVDNSTLQGGYTAMVDEIRGLAEKIDSAGKQLQALIGDVLDLSRIEANTLHVELAPVELGPIVESTLSQMRSVAQGKKIKIIGDIEDATLKSDETRLRQVLINLIGNAIKFTDKGNITVHSHIVENMMRIEVSDTGVGIPQNAIATIFDRFTQADASSTRNEGGAGLGLAITKEIVSLHGGEIAVDESTEQGTTIYFTIPLWREEAAA